MDRPLSEAAEGLVREERELLSTLARKLRDSGAPRQSLAVVDTATQHLDDLFLLVVVGEFNSGKSAFINALLGDSLLEEGVTPTTDSIHKLHYGTEHRVTVVHEGLEEIAAPIELLRDVAIVDTPGTNAIERRHEEITQRFVPRADFVLFLTSADRPIPESERSFLETLGSWGKKILVVVNKADLLESEEDREQVRRFVATSTRDLLGGDGNEPPVFLISARKAVRARDGNGASDPGFDELIEYLTTELDAESRLRLKLTSPLELGRRVVREHLDDVASSLEILDEDVALLSDLEGQQRVFREDLRREFSVRARDVDATLLAIENRGHRFFDDVLRIARVPDLLNRSRIQRAFENEVVADAPGEIDRSVSDLIDWMVDRELRQWSSVTQFVSRRQAAHEERIVGELGSEVTSSRSRLLASLGEVARATVASYDREDEANRLADSFRRSVTSAALLEAGAVGLGSIVAFAATSTAMDVTGLLAAGTLAALGLVVIPTRRRRAKATLRSKLEELRTELRSGLDERFESELEHSVLRLEEAVAPYTRFVRAESDRLSSAQTDFAGLSAQLDNLESRITAELGDG